MFGMSHSHTINNFCNKLNAFSASTQFFFTVRTDSVCFLFCHQKKRSEICSSYNSNFLLYHALSHIQLLFLPYFLSLIFENFQFCNLYKLKLSFFCCTTHHALLHIALFFCSILLTFKYLPFAIAVFKSKILHNFFRYSTIYLQLVIY